MSRVSEPDSRPLGLVEQTADHLQGGDVDRRVRRLRPDMERDAADVHAGGARLQNQRQRFVLVGAVLGAEIDDAAFVLDRDAEQDAGIGRVQAQLGNLVRVVEGEPLHAVPDAGDDVGILLHRVRMEQALGRHARRCRQRDLRIRGHVNPVDQPLEQPQQLGVGVRLHRVIQLDARQTRSQGPDALLNARGSEDQKRRRHGSRQNRCAIEGQVRLDWPVFGKGIGVSAPFPFFISFPPRSNQRVYQRSTPRPARSRIDRDRGRPHCPAAPSAAAATSRTTPRPASGRRS